MVGEQFCHQGFCDTVCQQVTEEDIDGKFDNGLKVGLAIPERVILVEKITQDAAEKIVGSRREPVTEMKHIVKNEHNGCPKQCVNDSYQDEPVC